MIAVVCNTHREFNNFRSGILIGDFTEYVRVVSIDGIRGRKFENVLLIGDPSKHTSATDELYHYAKQAIRA